MRKILGCGLCLLVAAAAAAFVMNGGPVSIGEWAGELADWIMSRDESR